MIIRLTFKKKRKVKNLLKKTIALNKIKIPSRKAMTLLYNNKTPFNKNKKAFLRLKY